MTNRRNVFGWDLPPGVTQRMIDETVNNADPAEIDAILEEIEILEEQHRVWTAKIDALYDKLRKIANVQ